jgi:hypothetical protein
MNSPVLIPLTRGLFATVDAADAEAVRSLKWYATTPRGRVYYAVHDLPSGRGVYMHRWLLDAPSNMTVDHVDLNGLNNQRSNLRLETRSQNQFNTGSRGGTSRFKGVSFCKQTGRWKTQIASHGKRWELGRFKDEEAAARAYDRAALELHGEFARLNFPATTA